MSNVRGRKRGGKRGRGCGQSWMVVKEIRRKGRVNPGDQPRDSLLMHRREGKHLGGGTNDGHQKREIYGSIGWQKFRKPCFAKRSSARREGRRTLFRTRGEREKAVYNRRNVRNLPPRGSCYCVRGGGKGWKKDLMKGDNSS